MIKRARFSLLELMIVLTIMGLVLGLAVMSPRLVPAGIQAKRAMKAVNIAFHTASSRALSTGTTMKLTFDFEGSKVTITGVGGGRGGGVNTASGDSGKPDGPVARHFAKYGNFKLPEMVKLNENRLSRGWEDEEGTVYYFYPNGEAVGPMLPLLVNEMIEVDIDVVRLTGKPMYVEHE
jgi:prepilin-type N-terminal cleavage/methylation domain-containing protein